MKRLYNCPPSKYNSGVTKVMNAPREYYPMGYDKNFDDNFASRVDLPDTSFYCGDQKHFPGLYADEDLGCMVKYHFSCYINFLPSLKINFSPIIANDSRCFTSARWQTTAWSWRVSSVPNRRCSTRRYSSATGGSTWTAKHREACTTAIFQLARAISWWRLWRSSRRTKITTIVQPLLKRGQKARNRRRKPRHNGTESLLLGSLFR